jgi:hypothetical protein
MTGVHLFLGLAVVGLNAVAGAQALAGRSGQLGEAVAGWAIGILGLQIASGMFLLTAIVRGPGVLHVILPVAGFVAVLGARLVTSEVRSAALGGAHLFAAVVSAFAFFTGVAA